MHSVTHSLAHRAQAPATRARGRCHPHYYFPTSASARSTPSTPAYPTPSSSSGSIPAPTPSATRPSQASLVHVPPSVALPFAAHHSATNPQQRNRLASAIVDLAVDALCSTWPIHAIPSVFASLVPKRARSEHVAGPFVAPVPAIPPPPSQLPSPPSSPSSSAEDSFDDGPVAAESSMRGFVIEVLRRSRSPSCVVQTALCYLHAIRPKVFELAAQERAGNGIRGESDQSPRIVLAGALGVCEKETDIEELLDPASFEPGNCRTLQPAAVPAATATSSQFPKKPRTDPATLAPMPLLPSPLLDPRRTFIAALVLASKFAQDKCYSNRAWAKLAGLPPREIGRAERALGDALEWRLWVGKTPPSNTRALGRTQSESSAFSQNGSVASMEQVVGTCTSDQAHTPPGSSRSLRRSSTLPASTLQPYAPATIHAHGAPPPPSIPAPYLQAYPSSESLPFHATMQGPWMPVMQPSPSTTRSWLEPTPQLSASPATTESSVDEQRTVQLFDLPEMPPPSMGLGMDAKGLQPPPYVLPLHSSVGSFGSEGGIVVPGWEAGRIWVPSQEWSMAGCTA